MARTTYTYNAETCKYEPHYVKGKELWKKVFIFVTLSLAVAAGSYAWFMKEVGSIDEIVLTRRNEKLKKQWGFVRQKLTFQQERLSALIDRDDDYYRVILDTEPLPAEVRQAGTGGSEKIDLSEIGNYPSLVEDYRKLESLKNQADVEAQSYEQLKKTAGDRIRMWASRPAIQPIANKQLDRLHMTYGARLHPLFHVWTDHKGLDFAAQKGTPVYATGDGRVDKAHYSESFGNVIYLSHGFGYETRYAHLTSFNITPGQRVKRGQVIGFVGNTGNSVGPHLHYEVLYHNEHVNPINFFQRDLNNKEYEKLIEIGSQQYHPLD